MTEPLKELIDHETACFTIGLLAEKLDIEIPTEPSQVRFFLTRLESLILTHRKQSAAGQDLIKALKIAIGR